MKAADASYPNERQRLRDYYEQTLLSRLNNKSEGRIVVIQQRLHEDDLLGHLIESGEFTHLNLRAIATDAEAIPIGFGRHHRRAKNEERFPEREPMSTLEQLRKEMGPSTFSAQYQQDPTPPGGNRIRWEWFGTYDETPPREAFEWIAQSWDTALTSEPSSDFTVGMTWGFRNGDWCLIDLMRDRLDFPDLKRRVRALAERHAADIVLIEKAGSGISLMQQLRHEDPRRGRYRFSIPRVDKETRLEAQTARLETGKHLLPEAAPWLEELRLELLAFPRGRYDDQVDALAQFLEWSGSPRGSGLVERDPRTGRPARTNRPPGLPFR
ncbi:MAG: phage terminase large subunit [Microvirga sp.]|nr:phage terminase large subunit [Microvirga sp.]